MKMKGCAIAILLLEQCAQLFRQSLRTALQDHLIIQNVSGTLQLRSHFESSGKVTMVLSKPQLQQDYINHSHAARNNSLMNADLFSHLQVVLLICSNLTFAYDG